jgi:hypothetical protein
MSDWRRAPARPVTERERLAWKREKNTPIQNAVAQIRANKLLKSDSRYYESEKPKRWKLSAATKAKMSAAKKGKPRSKAKS